MRDALAHWGVEVRRELTGGHRNRAFLVDHCGILCVAKTTRHSEASLRWVLPVLAVAARVGLAPPMLMHDRNGRLAPGGVTLEPYVAGRAARRGDLQAIAPRIARLHAALRGMPKRPGPPGRSAPRSHETALAAARSRLPSARVTTIHGDLTPANLLLTATGPVLIDWDEARVDHPGFDLPLSNRSPALTRARFAHEVVEGWHLEPSYARALARQRWRYF